MFGFTIHCGAIVDRPCTLEVQTKVRVGGNLETRLYNKHPIKRWYGISYKHSWMIGFFKFDKSFDVWRNDDAERKSEV